MSVYDRNNIFGGILRGEASCVKVYEDEFALAFHNIHPQTPIRLVANHGPDANQIVFHFHVHIMGGRRMSRVSGALPNDGHLG